MLIQSSQRSLLVFGFLQYGTWCCQDSSVDCSRAWSTHFWMSSWKRLHAVKFCFVESNSDISLRMCASGCCDGLCCSNQQGGDTMWFLCSALNCDVLWLFKIVKPSSVIPIPRHPWVVHGSSVSTGHPRLVHRSSTGHPRVIHRSSTGHPRFIHVDDPSMTYRWPMDEVWILSLVRGNHRAFWISSLSHPGGWLEEISANVIATLNCWLWHSMWQAHLRDFP